MTLLESLEPLLKAAEKYAEAAKIPKKSPNDIVRFLEAENELKAAAIEFAKWGR